MYTVTFYSFKGGVGRTMALVNIGAYLATIGRRVLLVDFDLEAPGIETFPGLVDKTNRSLGIVDYVSAYAATGKMSALESYVYRSEIDLGSGTGALLVMPAGKQDSSYGNRLNSINWLDFYREKAGYLFFEELKARWAALPVDYVLIDSRTGHTDIGGICTRQLPDAVVVVFFPNDQNLAGLRKVVEDIEDEKAGPLKKRTDLHFVMSNVPELDDEENILETHLGQFRESLHFSELTGIVHHYPSMQLLDQRVFTTDRPRTGLAKEYKLIAQNIVARNLEDREGALTFLKRRVRSASTVDTLEQIKSKHSDDKDVLYALSTVHDQQGRPDDALALLTAAENWGYKTAELYVRSAELQIRQGDHVAASVSLRKALSSEESSWSAVDRIVRILTSPPSDDLGLLPDSPAFAALDAREKSIIASELSEDRLTFSIAEKILRRLLTVSAAGDVINQICCALSLILIATARFTEAKAMIALANDRDSIADAFNLAMADWGEHRRMNADLFQQVLDLGAEEKPEHNANYAQCLAISSWAVGDRKSADKWVKTARRQTTKHGAPQFSAWRYWKVTPLEFAEDIELMVQMFDGESRVPFFMTPDLFETAARQVETVT